MYIISTSAKATIEEINLAKEVAIQFNMPYVHRGNQSLPKLCERHAAQGALIFSKEGPLFCNAEGKQHAFHLSMAHLRLLSLERGGKDHLLEAIGKDRITSFLDCTLGLGSDSAVVSFGCPHLTQHVALEVHPLVGYITNYGFRHFHHKNEEVTHSLRNIQVALIDYQMFLEKQKDKSWDVIYFDPMFETPVYESPQFKILRPYLKESSMNEDILELALQKGKRVVIKERRHSQLFQHLIPHELWGGTYSSVAYGVYYA